MKKIISMMLVLAMVLSMSVSTVFAAEIGGNWQGGTVVTYNADATATEYYTVTVPAALDPGDRGTVSAEGNFPSNKTLKVTADTSVGLTDGISTKTLGVSFAGIELVGSDTAAVTASNSVSVANWSDEVKAPLFGEWEGTFNYFVEVVEDTTGGDSGTTEPSDPDTGDGSDTEVCSHSKTITINAVAAKCNAAGYTGDTYCNDCQTTIATGSNIDATGVCADENSDNVCDDCGTSIEEVSIINFTIDGVSYQAEKGMSWEEWCESEYNTNNTFVLNDDANALGGCTISKAGDTSGAAVRFGGVLIRSTSTMADGKSYTYA